MKSMELFKAHQEFRTLDMNEGWTVPVGYPEGIEEKILSGRLDEKAKCGSRTRLLRFRPGAFSTEPFIHEYWEEVLLISGDLIVGTGEDAQSFLPHSYTCRPPGIYHGPFKSDGGCLLVEVHYFD